MEVNQRKPSKKQIDFIYSRIARHKELAESMYGADKIVGVFIFGSWNVGSWYDGSDIDTTVLINMDKPNEYVIPIPDGSGEVSFHADFCGYLAHFCNPTLSMIQFRAIEILGTKYNYVNPKYQKIWYKISAQSPGIVRCSAPKILASEVAKLEANINTLQQNIIKFGVDSPAPQKSLYRMLQSRRQVDAVQDFDNWGDGFYYCASDLAKIRSDKSQKTCGDIYNTAIQELISIRQIQIVQPTSQEKTKVQDFLRTIIREIQSKT